MFNRMKDLLAAVPATTGDTLVPSNVTRLRDPTRLFREISEAQSQMVTIQGTEADLRHLFDEEKAAIDAQIALKQEEIGALRDKLNAALADIHEQRNRVWAHMMAMQHEWAEATRQLGMKCERVYDKPPEVRP